MYSKKSTRKPRRHHDRRRLYPWPVGSQDSQGSQQDKRGRPGGSGGESSARREARRAERERRRRVKQAQDPRTAPLHARMHYENTILKDEDKDGIEVLQSG